MLVVYSECERADNKETVIAYMSLLPPASQRAAAAAAAAEDGVIE